MKSSFYAQCQVGNTAAASVTSSDDDTKLRPLHRLTSHDVCVRKCHRLGAAIRNLR